MKWLKERSLYLKTVLGMLTISLTVLLLVATIMLLWFRKELAAGYYNLTKAAMGNTDTIFSQMIEEIKERGMQWYQDPDGVSLRLDPDTDFSQHIGYINEIQNTLIGNNYIQGICYINKNKEVRLNIGNRNNRTEKIEEKILTLLEKEELKENHIVWKGKEIYSEEEIPVISFVTKEMGSYGENFRGMTVVSIDLRELNKSIFNSEQKEEPRFLILNEKGYIVGDSMLANLGENWSEKEWVQKILQGEGRFQFKEGNTKLECIAAESSQKGFYVVTLSKYAAGIASANHMFNWMFAIIFAAIFVIVVMMLTVSKRIFQPFQNMIVDLKQKENLWEGEVSADEVVFLKQYYEGINAHMQELNEKKESDLLIKMLLLGNQGQEVSRFLLEKGILQKNGFYYLVEVFFENDEDVSEYDMQDYDMLRGMIGQIFSEQLGKCGKCTCLESGLRRLLLILSGSEDGKLTDENLKEEIEEARASVRKLARVNTYVLFSDCRMDNGLQCADYFTRINNTVKTRYMLEAKETRKVSFEEDAERKGAEQLQKVMAEALKQQDETRYRETVENEMDFLSGLPYQDMLNALTQITIELQKIGKISKNGKETEDTLLEKAGNLAGKEELWKWFEDIYEETNSKKSKARNSIAFSMMEEATDYIRNNYDNRDLNVNLLAEKLNISASYFGKLFTEFTGYKMLDYLLQVRMEKAKELLLVEKDLDIAKLAEKVGYANSTYFITAFRKYTGTTPSKYREGRIRENLIEREK